MAKIWELKDMWFYPRNSKHRDGRHRSGLGATAIPAGDGALTTNDERVYNANETQWRRTK